MLISVGFVLFTIAFYEVETYLLTEGKHKSNVSKHDYVFGSTKLSIDMAISLMVILIVTLCIIWACFSDGDGGDGDCLACCCCDAHTMDSLYLNGRYHCDCCCGVDTRREFTNYKNYEYDKER